MHNIRQYRLNILKAFWADLRQNAKRCIQLMRMDDARMQEERVWTIQYVDSFGRWAEVDGHDVMSMFETVGIHLHPWYTYDNSERLTLEQACAIAGKMQEILTGSGDPGRHYKFAGRTFRIYSLLDDSVIPLDIF